MKHLHLVVPDLILPRQLADYACKDIAVPVLEKLLARATSETLNIDTLEAWLCGQFGLEGTPVAPVTLLADGLLSGELYWLRVDPVAIQMQQSRIVLQSVPGLLIEEAAELCASLNAHFAEDGFHFAAPHPQRWYLGLPVAPDIVCTPLPQALGADMQENLPTGAEALRWHGLMNEMQMLMYGHPVNEAREQRGEVAVSGVWLWGGGSKIGRLQKPFAAIASTGDLAAAFARASDAPQRNSVLQLLADVEKGDVLLVWEGLARAIQAADISSWRDSLLQLEETVIRQAWEALMSGELDQVTLDVLREGGSRRFVVKSSARWKWWRFAKKLPQFAGR